MKFKGKISNIKLFGYHGILDHEIEEGQNFEIDVDYMYSIPYKHLNDEIQNTVDYMDVYFVVKSVFKNERCNLIETLSFKIAEALKNSFPIVNCNIKIRKPEINMNGEVGFIEVSLNH